jgi:hypothetical protein
MTYLDAAIAVLKRSPRPMTVREITEAALRADLIQPHGKTPQATMSATLYVHLREADTPIVRREYIPGPIRAVRDSVRWSYDG